MQRNTSKLCRQWLWRELNKKQREAELAGKDIDFLYILNFSVHFTQLLLPPKLRYMRNKAFLLILFFLFPRAWKSHRGLCSVSGWPDSPRYCQEGFGCLP